MARHGELRRKSVAFIVTISSYAGYNFDLERRRKCQNEESMHDRASADVVLSGKIDNFNYKGHRRWLVGQERTASNRHTEFVSLDSCRHRVDADNASETVVAWATM